MSDHMLDAEQAIAKLRADNCRLVDDRNNWQKRAEAYEQAARRLQCKRRKLIEERDAALADLDEANVNNHGLTIEVANMRAGLALATAERDAAERERTESRAEVVRLRAECEGLRWDLLAHPPDHTARIAELQATIETLREDGKNCEAEYVAQRDKIVELQADLAQVRYERDTALAASRERHVANAALWESQQEQQRQAESIIEGLRDCLERTEKRYIEAKARQVPRALVGLLGVIRREAAAAEKMIL